MLSQQTQQNTLDVINNSRSPKNRGAIFTPRSIKIFFLVDLAEIAKNLD
jgi:hypothetical protein